MSTHIKICKEKDSKFPEELILNWFAQVLLALKFIHRFNILHRDLKTSNIFLQENGELKIGDFGIARVLDGTLHNAESVVGTPYYMSPEICQNLPYSFKSDVWSLGCVLFELCTLEHPFKSPNLLNLVYKIVHEDPGPIPSKYSPELQDLVLLLLQKRVSDRPTLDELIQTEFVSWFLIEFMNPEPSQADHWNAEELSTRFSRTIQLEGQNTGTSQGVSLMKSPSNQATSQARVSNGHSMKQLKGNQQCPGENKQNLQNPLEISKSKSQLEKRAFGGSNKVAMNSSDKTSFRETKQEIQNHEPWPKEHLKEGLVGVARKELHNKSGAIGKQSNGMLKGSCAVNPDSCYSKKSEKSQREWKGEGVSQSKPFEAENECENSLSSSFRKNLDVTIQSQYLQGTIASNCKNQDFENRKVAISENEDFPPDFDDFDEFGYQDSLGGVQRGF